MTCKNDPKHRCKHQKVRSACAYAQAIRTFAVCIQHALTQRNLQAQNKACGLSPLYKWTNHDITITYGKNFQHELLSTCIHLKGHNFYLLFARDLCITALRNAFCKRQKPNVIYMYNFINKK